LQAFLEFPPRSASCQTAVISGAAPVNVTLTLDESESKVKYYFLSLRQSETAQFCSIRLSGFNQAANPL
jgi:hypothetical protein